MWSLLIVLAAGVAALAAATDPVRRGLPLVVGAILLVPSSLVVPNGVSGLPTFVRVVLYATLAGTFLAAYRGRLAPDALRPTPIHALVLALPVVALVVGIGLGLPIAPLREAASTWLRFVDGAVVFLVAVALTRATSDIRRVRWTIVAIVVAAASIGAVEHLTGESWGRLLFSQLPSQQATDAASPLGFRGGQVRVRGAAEFALEYGWLLVALLPMVLLTVADLGRRWRWVAPLMVGLPLAVSFWTYARSALAAVLPVVIVSAVLVRERWHGWSAAALVAGAGVAVLTAPLLLVRHTFRADVGSIEVRVDRLPEILSFAATRPFSGLGLGALSALGYPVADSSYLASYAEMGAVGVAVLVTAVVLVIAAVTRGAVAPSSAAQRIAGAAAAGLVGLAASAFAYDTFHLAASGATFWLLAGVGLAAAERAGRPVWWPAGSWRPRLALAGGALGTGVVIALATPVVWVGDVTFTTLPTFLETRLHTQDHIGRPLVGTVCGLVDASDGQIGDARVDCYRDISADGVGRLHVVGPERGAVDGAVATLDRWVVDGAGIESLRTFVAEAAAPARPTLARTAPAWLAIAVLGLASVRRGRTSG